MLTEIAHQNNIGTDYHLNEPPLDIVDISHYKYRENKLWITADEHDEIDELLDWLTDKQRQGWAMVNSIAHLQNFKNRQRGDIPSWDCRAGHNGAFIKADGSLSPCFDLMTHDGDWGRIWEPKFDQDKLTEVKKKCLPSCSSTCMYTLGSYYNLRNLPEWVIKHTRMG